MSEDVDHRITPALHPDNVKQVEGYDDETASILAPTMTAFSTAYEGVRSVYAAREAADRNPAWTEEARLIQVDGFSQKHLDKITCTFDSVRGNLDKGIAHLEGELSQPVESKAAHPVASEVRAHFKGLPTGERISLIRQAINEGDHLTATSILGAPAYLSGLDPQMQKVLTRMYHEHHQPQVSKRLRAMQSAKAMIEERGGLVFSAMEKAVGGSSAKAKKLREAHTAAEKALILKDV